LRDPFFRSPAHPDSSFLPAGKAWGHASQSAEVPSEVTLVGKPNSNCDLGQWQLSVTQHLFDVFEASPQQISVRRRPNRLSESAREMVRGKPRHGRERVESYFLVEMRFNVFAYAVCDRR
jgi:hypothetical protein